MEGIIKATWELLAKSRYTDNLNKWRKHGRPVHVIESIWARWNEAWGTAEFRARSERVAPRFPVRPDWRIRTGFGVRNHILGIFTCFFFFFFSELNLYLWVY